jgi:hypothetical protein
MARRAANTQPRQRLALLLVATAASFGVLESNTYRALPLAAGYASAFKFRQPDHYFPFIFTELASRNSFHAAKCSHEKSSAPDGNVSRLALPIQTRSVLAPLAASASEIRAFFR